MKPINKITYVGIFLIIIIEIIFIIYIFTNNYRKYKTIIGVISNNNEITMYVNNKELKSITNNKKIIIDNKVITNYEVDNITKKVLKKSKNYYHQMIIKTKISKKYKYNDSIKITIYYKKEKLYKILKCWR